MKKQNEDNLQAALCKLCRLQYPKEEFNSDMSGVRLTKGQAVKAKGLRSGAGFPDFVLYVRKMSFGALFLELKREGENPYKKNGELKKSRIVDKRTGEQHLQRQEKKIKALRKAGYFAAFVVGFDNASEALRAYMEGDFLRLGEVTEGPDWKESDIIK